jgi:hypothetical protein
MNKYLELSFKNAGLIITDNKTNGGKQTKDKLPYSLNYDNSRNVSDRFDEPITIYQISNVIHKLFGERPVPTFRYSKIPIIEYLYNKALESYLKIDNVLDQNGNFIKETFMTNKGVYNAYSPTFTIDWFKIKRMLNDDAYVDFLSLIKDLYNEIPQSFNDLVDMIKNDENNYNKVIKFFSDRKLTIFTYIFKNQGNSINKIPSIQRTINYGKDYISIFKGNIYIPINEDDIEKIKNGPGTSTILDGGLVKIEGILNEEDLPDDMGIKVSEISTKQLKDLENENKN